MKVTKTVREFQPIIIEIQQIDEFLALVSALQVCAAGFGLYSSKAQEFLNAIKSVQK
jgi:hypothetical protein